MDRRAMILMLVLAGSLAACGRPAPPPAPSGGLRIVALSPALGIMLRDLGIADRVVGRHGWDMVLDKALPVCGDQAGIDYEALIRASPTHVILEWGSRPLPQRLTDLATEQGWLVVNYALLTLDDLSFAAGDLHARFAPDAPSLSGSMARAWSRRDGVFAGRTLLLMSADPPSALGPGSFHQQILERIGGVPALVDGKPYMTMDAEDVLRLAPEAIILIAPRPVDAASGIAREGDRVRAMLGRLGTLDIPAVRSGRLALIDDPLSLTPSSAMIGLADELARILAAWGD